MQMSAYVILGTWSFLIGGRAWWSARAVPFRACRPLRGDGTMIRMNERIVPTARR